MPNLAEFSRWIKLPNRDWLRKVTFVWKVTPHRSIRNKRNTTVDAKSERADLLEICVRLNNVRAELVGINHIRSVYMPLWTRTRADEELWTNFEHMLFGDQRRANRVSRFHNIAVYE